MYNCNELEGNEKPLRIGCERHMGLLRKSKKKKEQNVMATRG